MESPARVTMERSPPASSEAALGDGSGISPAVLAREAYALIRRHRPAFLAALLLVYGWGLLYYYSRQPIYEARASVLVHGTAETLSGKVVDTQDLLQGYLPTHTRLITSTIVLKRACEKLNARRGQDQTRLSPEALAGSLTVTWQKDTEILDIIYRTTQRKLAAGAVEAVVGAYMEVVNETHRTTSKDILQILTQQKEDLDRQISAKESQLLALQKSQGVLAVSENHGNLALSRVSALNQALTQTRVRKLELQSRYDAVLAARARGRGVDLLPARPGITPTAEPEVAGPGAEDARSSGLRRELLQDQLELQRLKGVYGPNHPRIKILDERVRLVRERAEQLDRESAAKTRTKAELAARARRQSEATALAALADELREAQDLERSLSDQFEKDKSQAVDFTRHQAPLGALETDLEQLRKVYDAIIDRIRQVNLGGDYGVITTQLIEPPCEPQEPIFPNLRKILQLCTFLGLTFGVAICYAFDRWHTSYRGPEDIALHLALPVVGHIPELPRSSAGVGELWLQDPSRSRSVEAEAFRNLRTALLLRSHPPRKLAITSCGTGDGKTLILANLAIAYAHLGMRTLLIDGDLRRPRLQHIFKLAEGPGLADFLQQPTSEPEYLERNIRQTALQHLDVLPSGTRSANPGELLTGTNLGALFSWAEQRYQRILCDVSPILAVSDCALLGRWLDGILLVVRGDRNDRIQAARARDLLRSMNCPVIGVVVNRLQPRSAYGYTYYQSYHSSFYVRSTDDRPGEGAAGGPAEKAA
jgi:capsular exopolysaccharide synthesis family protein